LYASSDIIRVIKIKEFEVGGARSTRRIDDTKFWPINLKERGNTEDIGVDGRIILELMFREIEWEGVNWIHVAQERDQWRVWTGFI
jgi:hypothetical protein